MDNIEVLEEKEETLEIRNSSNSELLSLYEAITYHLKYLNDNIISLEEDESNE